MTPKERGIAALRLKIPDIVPTFELQFELTEELLGKRRLRAGEWDGIVGKERGKKLVENAELFLKVAEKLDYSIIRIHWLPTLEDEIKTIKLLKKWAGDRYLIAADAEGTFCILEGDVKEFVYRLTDHPEDVKEEAEKKADKAIERGKRLTEAGVDVITMTADYCFNNGPFMSPEMFEKFITPYLRRTISSHKKEGAYVIKHTDGNIMPILDQLLWCGPDALHSIDPIAGMDLRKMKDLVGEKVCLCGNVNMKLLHTGTIDEVKEDAMRSLKEGVPGGGYIFCSSCDIFKGIPLENYLTMLKIREEETTDEGLYSRNYCL